MVYILRKTGLKQIFSLVWLLSLVCFVAAFLMPIWLAAAFTVLGLIILALLFSAILKELSTLEQKLKQGEKFDYDYRKLELNALALGKPVTQLIELLRELSRQNNALKAKINEVEHASLQVIESAQQVAHNVQNQSDSTNSTAAAILEMNQSLQQVSEKIQAAFELSTQAQTDSESGKRYLTQLKQEIEDVKADADTTQTQMSELDTLAESVADMSNIIQDISAQTNLLALNASIEAARAGDLGRGFAVVADEVRALADRSSQAANQITGNVKQVLEKSRLVNFNMKQVVDRSTSCLQTAGQTEIVIANMHDKTRQVQAEMQMIASNTEQQNQANQEISEHIERVVIGAQANAEVAEQAGAIANHLKSLTQNQIIQTR
ncbi:methyl-accepting chemotaxis protein [Catenovulum sp. 2E275]|uniref:methyl-accepting chemotaxis protein n=1 Tax=Catenovulum sp. 2E275 TaxID=2980497 RepID=UPI0021D22B95|nr:methyl-accepting chemotaxis protein [Catenovulum sp. 2E275]MCU4675780.1 methyl-accepting chemotaxis protein [Catenovulum sp. 2E275]